MLVVGVVAMAVVAAVAVAAVLAAMAAGSVGLLMPLWFFVGGSMMLLARVCNRLEAYDMRCWIDQALVSPDM
jgi:hypothetical protein